MQSLSEVFGQKVCLAERDRGAYIWYMGAVMNFHEILWKGEPSIN